MINQPLLPRNYWDEKFNPGSMSVQQLNEYPPVIGQFDTFASTSKVGRMKSVSFFRTKQYTPRSKRKKLHWSEKTYENTFKPKVSWKFNPFEVLEYEGISNPIEGKVTTYKNSTVKIAEYSGNPALFWDHEYPPYSLAPLWLDENQAGISLTKAFSKVQSPDADIGLMLAEIRDTIQLFTSPIQKFAKNWNKLHRGLSKMTHRKAATMATSRWMELRYGLLPTISDIESLVDLFLKKHEIMEGDLIKKKDQTLLEQSNSYGNPEWRVLGNNGCYGYGRRVREVESRLNSSVYYCANMHFPNAKLGISIGDLPSLLYELTPYSFVFDWFVNFGDWLRAIQPKPGLTFLNALVSGTEIVRDRLEIIAFSAYPQYLPWVTGQVFCSYEKRTKKYVRTVNNPLPATPQVHSNCLDLFRKLDSLSMLWQQLPKPKRG